MADVIDVCCVTFPLPHLSLLEILQHNFGGPKHLYLFW